MDKLVIAECKKYKMKASEICISAIKGFEGLKLKAYKCPAGVSTIGYGHTKGVKMGQTITQTQADSLLMGDILPIEIYLNKLGVLKTQGEFDALTDFAYNLGISALSKSTLLHKIIGGSSDKDIQKEFRRWTKVANKESIGLIKRREWETQQWIRKE